MRARGRRLLAIAIVLGSTVAAADIVPQPAVSVLVDTAGSNAVGTNTVSLFNSGTGSATINSVTGTCPPDVELLAPLTAQSLASMTSYPASYTCTSSPSYGMHRCHYSVNGSDGSGSADDASYLAVCEVTNGGGSGTVITPTIAPFGGSAGGTGMTLPYLMASGSGMFFGSGAITGNITITNEGSDTITTLGLQIAGPDTDKFAFINPCGGTLGCDAAVTLGSGAMTTLGLTCTPGGSGTFSAELYAVGDDGAALPSPMMLTCVGSGSSTGPALSVSPLPVDLEAELGASAMKLLTLTNAGATPLEIDSFTLTGGSAGWTVMPQGACGTALPCSLPANGGTATVELTYAPTAFGSDTAQLAISSGDTGFSPLMVDLVGIGDGATMSLDSMLGAPPTLDFGTVLVGGSASASFELRNDGNESRTITLALSGTTAAYMLPSTISLGPSGTGGDTQVTVTCSPHAAGPAPAMLDASGSDLYMSSDVTIAFACTGSTGALLATPGFAALGEVRADSTPAPITFVITTTDLTSFTLNAPTFQGTPPHALSLGPLSNTTLMSGSSATFQLSIDPGADESLDAHIELTTSNGHMLEIPVTGEVVHATASAPATVNLGTFCVSSVPSPVLTSLRATGTGAVGLPIAPALASTTSAFGLTPTSPTTYPATLAAGSAATVMLSVNAQATAGSATDTLTWHTDLPATPTLATAVQVTFVAGGGGVQPGSIDFGAIPVNSTAPQQVVTIKNCGTTDLPLGAITLATPFTHGDLPETTIAAQGSVTLTVGFAPTSAGSFDSTLTIKSSPDLTVELRGSTASGSNMMPGDDDGGGISDLYACGCRGATDPSGALAIVGVLGFVMLVPRRRRA